MNDLWADDDDERDEACTDADEHAALLWFIHELRDLLTRLEQRLEVPAPPDEPRGTSRVQSVPRHLLGQMALQEWARRQLEQRGLDKREDA